MKRSYGSIYNRAVQRGCDHGYAMFLADEWKNRQREIVHLIPADGGFTACGHKPGKDWAVTTNEAKITCRSCIRCLGTRERRRGQYAFDQP